MAFNMQKGSLKGSELWAGSSDSVINSRTGLASSFLIACSSGTSDDGSVCGGGSVRGIYLGDHVGSLVVQVALLVLSVNNNSNNGNSSDVGQRWVFRQNFEKFSGQNVKLNYPTIIQCWFPSIYISEFVDSSNFDFSSSAGK